MTKDADAIRNFGAKVRYLREQAGLTQTELAAMIGLSKYSKGFISEIELGKKVPRAELIIRLAECFHVSTDYLLFDSIDIHKRK